MTRKVAGWEGASAGDGRRGLLTSSALVTLVVLMLVVLPAASSWSAADDLDKAAPPHPTPDDRFGVAVDIWENRFIIGDSGRADQWGVAYIYEQPKINQFELLGFLRETDIGAHDRFGHAVAIEGGTAVVSAHMDQGGSVYVYEEDPAGNWDRVAKLRAPNWDGSNAFFGSSLDLEDGWLAVGEPDTYGGPGAVHLYKRATTGDWVFKQTLVAGDPAAPAAFQQDAAEGDRLGDDVAIDLFDNTGWVLAGAPQHDGHGAAYLWNKDGDTWYPHTKLEANDATAHDRFADSVALNESVAAIGARQPWIDPGKVYVFEGPGGQWAQVQKISPRAAQKNLGWDLAMDGRTLAIGAKGASDGLHVGEVDAYVQDATGTWTLAHSYLPRSTDNEGYAWQLAVHGNHIIVGAPFDDMWGYPTGSIYLYTEALTVGNPCEQSPHLTSDCEPRLVVKPPRPPQGPEPVPLPPG